MSECFCEVNREYSKRKTFCFSKCPVENASEICSCPKYKINSNNKISLFSGSFVNCRQLIQQIHNFGEIDGYYRIVYAQNEYCVPTLSAFNSIFWGREVRKEYLLINIMVFYKGYLGRLVIRFKNSKIIEIANNPVCCPAIFTRHCDQYHAIEYVIKEIVYNTVYDEDINLISEIFHRKSLVFLRL